MVDNFYSILLSTLIGSCQSSYQFFCFFSLGGTLTIPVAGFTAVKEANQDYERWKVLRVLKIRDDMPDDQLPYRTRHDWTEFDRYLREHQLLK